jgi:hypothetical protein
MKPFQSSRIRSIINIRTKLLTRGATWMKKQRFVIYLFLFLMLLVTGCGKSSEAGVKELDPEQITNESEQENEETPEENGTNPTQDEDAAENGQDNNENTNEETEEAAEKDPGYVSPFTFEYPDAVRGIYVTGHSAGGSRFERLIELVDSTHLNAMVIDIKDDYGYLTYRPEEDSPFYPISKNYIKDVKAMLQTLEDHQIYPIARIVVFKDTVLAQEKPEWSFKNQGAVWKNGRGEAFVNPFVEDVWAYNVEIAKLAAELGFKEIQFDYVRFPEGFERRDKTLTYSMGKYFPIEIKNEEGQVIGEDLVQPRVHAVTDFVAYAKKELSEYNVDVSVDIFGYTATLPEAPGIGQNFSMISENVDVISSMIYPSHWTAYFGIAKPDTEPYRLVQAYAKAENERLNQLENRPISRPWLQDFTASWLGKGNYISYGVNEVEAQIKALNEAGIFEFLLWNASNNYTENVNYLPAGTVEEIKARLKAEAEAKAKAEAEAKAKAEAEAKAKAEAEANAEAEAEEKTKAEDETSKDNEG